MAFSVWQHFVLGVVLGMRFHGRWEPTALVIPSFVVGFPRRGSGVIDAGGLLVLISPPSTYHSASFADEARPRWLSLPRG